VASGQWLVAREEGVRDQGSGVSDARSGWIPRSSFFVVLPTASSLRPPALPPMKKTRLVPRAYYHARATCRVFPFGHARLLGSPRLFLIYATRHNTCLGGDKRLAAGQHPTSQGCFNPEFDGPDSGAHPWLGGSSRSASSAQQRRVYIPTRLARTGHGRSASPGC